MNKKTSKFRLRDHLCSFTVGTLTFLVSFFFSTRLLDKDSVTYVFEKISDIGITFSFTIFGFLLTAYAVLQVLTDKEWFSRIKRADTYKRFFHNLKALAYLIIILFFISLFSIFLPLVILNPSIQILYYSFMLFFMAFIVVRIFKVLILVLRILE